MVEGSGLAKVLLADVPVDGGFGTGVGGAEDKHFLLAGKAFRKVEKGVGFGIDDVEQRVAVRLATGFERR